MGFTGFIGFNDFGLRRLDLSTFFLSLVVFDTSRIEAAVPPSIVLHDSHFHSNIMNSRPMNRADLKLALEQETAKLNELLQIADDLLIPVDVSTQKTSPKSNNDVPVTRHLRTTIYPSRI